MPSQIDQRKLHPVSMRISDAQYTALKKLSLQTGLALQEHVRRAVDDYVERQRQKAKRAA